MFRNGREKENFHETIFFFSLETLVVTHITKEKNIAGRKELIFFATNSECVIPVSLQPVVIDLLPFKLRILTDQIV